MSTPAPRKIIIDTDPGQDDAFAILLALASPEFKLLGVTTVAGNVPLALTHVNARKVLELARRTEIPVFAGCERPMQRALRTAEHVHGATGLDGADLPEPTMPLQPVHAVDFIIDTLRKEASGSVTLCILGPMTNIATAMERAPDIIPKIAQIVAMKLTPRLSATCRSASMRGSAPLTRRSRSSSVRRPPPPPQQNVASCVVPGAIST